MEFIVSSASLLKGVLEVSKAIPAKTAFPILENFLFVLSADHLEITASDQEISMRTIVTVDSTIEEGSIAVPARQMTDLLKALPDQPITINIVSEGSFECRWSNGHSNLPYFAASDYPEIQEVEDIDIKHASFPAHVLATAISGTIYATAEDEMRPAMNGIFFDLDDDYSTLVASDSHKLICYSSNETKVEEKSSFILHKKHAAILRSAIDKVEGDVNLSYNAQTVEFRFADTVMISPLIKGKFPDYRRVIPQNNSNILKIDRIQLLNTVKRVAVCSNKASNHIKFELQNDQLEVTAQDLGFALAAYEKLDCDYNGDSLSIGFKSIFLADILSNMSCNTVVIKFADQRRASLILPAEEEEESGKLCSILMPIMVS